MEKALKAEKAAKEKEMKRKNYKIPKNNANGSFLSEKKLFVPTKEKRSRFDAAVTKQRKAGPLDIGTNDNYKGIKLENKNNNNNKNNSKQKRMSHDYYRDFTYSSQTPTGININNNSKYFATASSTRSLFTRGK